MGDFNRDGKTDIVSGSVNRVAILLGNGDGTFKPAVNIGTYPWFLAVADLDRDAVISTATNYGDNTYFKHFAST
ncbi:MAG: VCBS repeat-containing protein [Candidatus Midichloria sp.]|nr:VCBS repeat-containing protein [Candidatus Midichloria sp.]